MPFPQLLPEFFALFDIDLFLMLSLLTCLLDERFPKGNSIHLSDSSSRRVRKPHDQQRFPDRVWGVYAILVLFSLPCRSFGKHSCNQFISWNHEEAVELREGFHVHGDLSSSVFGCLVSVQLC